VSLGLRTDAVFQGLGLGSEARPGAATEWLRGWVGYASAATLGVLALHRAVLGLAFSR